MKTIQVELKKASRRADEGVSLFCDSLIEISSKEFGDLDSHRGDVAFLVLTDVVLGNEVNIDVDDIIKNLPQNDAQPNYKSPSKRFRDILWRLLEQKLKHKPTEEEFADYYKREYDKICSHYKEKFDDISSEEEKDE
jgi:hypothetical protein